MGDTPQQPGTSAEFPKPNAPAGAFQPSPAGVTGRVGGESSPAIPPPPYLQHQHGSPQHVYPSQLDMAQSYGPSRGGGGGGLFDMGAMANTLQQPTYRPGPYSQGQPHARYSTIAMPAPVSQFGASSPTAPAPAPAPGQQYYLPPPHAHLAHFYATPLPPQAQPTLASRADLAYYQNAVVVNQQQHPATQYYFPQASHFSGQIPQAPTQLMLGQYTTPSPQHVDPRQHHQHQAGGKLPYFEPPVDLGKGASESRHSIVRGPPRKPRQSGHAIWIGNLPPQTDLMSLVHHVCKETQGLESLFLISKSNCAFANFRDEQASAAAQRKLHDSKFLTVRLVSRLRKSTVEGLAGTTAPTGPAATAATAATAAPQADATPEPEPAMAGETEVGENSTVAPGPAVSIEDSRAVEGGPPSKDRFFVLKSLTVEDIELSVRTNIWATQSHNEEILNSAFKNADNVYLIFSANKSGEYFGYARMVSPINDDPGAAIEFAPKAQATGDVELPKAIPTEATEFAPKGRIIDDSARGTIFWEAEQDDQSGGTGTDEDGSGGGSVSGDTGSAKSGHEGAGVETKAWGKPFGLEWLSTARLPFYRTRGLRNPWNSNREVKIARDGTELEPSVGRRLIGLFNRAQSPALGLAPGVTPGTAPGVGRGPVQAGTFSPMR